MQVAQKIKTISPSRPRSVFAPALGLMILPVLAAIILSIAAVGGFSTGASFDFLLPWIFGLALLMAAPMLYLYRKGGFWLADPLVLATLTYFFPAFVIGGTFFAVGWSQPSFQSLILDPTYDLPLTVIVIALGYGGLAIGYLLPLSEKIGRKIKVALPEADHPTWSYFLPGVLLMGVGLSFLALNFSLGLLGYQITESMTIYDGLLHLTTNYWLMAGFLLWLLIFRQDTHPPYIVPILVLLIATGVARVLVSGGRGAIIQVATMILLAFVLSGRMFRFKQAAVAGILLTVALMMGMIYGSTFREVKGTEKAITSEQYIDSIYDTFATIESRDLSETVVFGLGNLVERVDILSTVAVVVSNHEHLKPYEEQYGIRDNIWIDMTTFFIPRILWPDKPSASDPRRFSDLYFNYAGSSYAITSMGDLIRNYGLIGVFLGMFAFGVVIRVVYSALIDREKLVIWRVTLYFMLISTVSYEAFYGTLIPTMVKIGFLAVIGLIIATYFAGRISRGYMKAERSA